MELGEGARISGKVDTGSGGVDLRNAWVGQDIDTGSGHIRLRDTTVEGEVRTRSGEVRLDGQTHVQGDLLVVKNSCWGLCWSNNPKPARVIIGAGARVDGTIRFEHDGELWVHEQARIGRVEGIQARRFSAESP